jgi:heptosyltransferase III
LILSLPALERLRSEYTEVWVSTRNVPLVQFADRVRSISSTGLDMIGVDRTQHFGFHLLEQFDDIVSWYGAQRPDFRESVAHLPFTFHTALPSGTGVHAIDFYMRQAGGPDGAVPRIDVPREDAGFVAMHPFSGSFKKNWPLENYQALAKSLSHEVRFCAGPEEQLAGAARPDDLYGLAKWLASARVFVGNDSGPAHLAAAVGTPVVAIFRATEPAVWAPRGPRVIVLRDPAVDQVRDAVESLW